MYTTSFHDFGNVLEHILDESSSKLTSNQTALNENGEVVRERRSLQQMNTNLQGLVKRLNVMEKRYADPGEDSAYERGGDARRLA